MSKTLYGPYFRYDESPIWEIHDQYFKSVGIKAWASGEIPYSGISNFAEAYKKALFLIENFKNKTDQGSLEILEIGAGYGEFAKNFLDAFEEICKSEDLDYFHRLKYYISDFSQKTLDELENSGRLKAYHEQISFIQFDALDKYSWRNDDSDLKRGKFDAILANYLLDQLPARIFAKSGDGYFEKYISIEDDSKYKKKQKSFFGPKRWIKKLRKKIEFRDLDLDDETNIDHRDILESCFRQDKASTIVYSYGALRAVKNFMYLIKQNGIIVCSDFNASTKPGLDTFEPCYYGNSLAQAVNFEFIYKYFSEISSVEDLRKLKHKSTGKKLGHQLVLIYEDPIKPLHTLILTRPDYEHSLELGEVYKKVYQQNWFLRALYKFVVELQLGFYILGILMLTYFSYWLIAG